MAKESNRIQENEEVQAEVTVSVKYQGKTFTNIKLL